MSTTAPTAAPSTTPSRDIPRLVAALIGLLAVAAALGAGQLVAGIVAPGSSPFFSVADTVIRLSPEWLTEFGKSLGPLLDKLLLQVGVGVAVAVVAVVAGLVSRRDPRRGVGIIVALGVIGAAAVLFSPSFAPLNLVAPLVTLGVGVGVFRWLHGLALGVATTPVGDVTGVRRRNVLIGAATGVGVASVGAGLGGLSLGQGVLDSQNQVTAMLRSARLAERAPALPPITDFTTVGTPTFFTPNASFYRIDTALRVPSVSASDWSLRIHGMVDKEISLSFSDLFGRRLVERDITMTCVSNPVGGDLISTARFVGVDLREVLMEAGVQSGADQIFSSSIDGWYTGTPTDVLLEPDRGAMLAFGMNGEALPLEHGFPVRMIVPGLYGFVSATKWVVDIEATTFEAEQGYWLERGWAQKAPIKTQSRIDMPRGFGKVAAGNVTVAGIAWAQHVGVGKVEVRIDEGPWQEAELTTEVNYNTWRMWRIDVQLAAGGHFAQVRTINARGEVQTDQRAEPIPDGASGWPSTFFTVT